MANSENRRYVAERLREEAEGYRNAQRRFGYDARIDTGNIPGVFQDMCAFSGLKGYIRCAEMFDRFADLIEPTERTCRMNRIETPLGFALRCDVCGNELGVYETKVERYAYCPHCGSRVVNADGH